MCGYLSMSLSEFGLVCLVCCPGSCILVIIYLTLCKIINSVVFDLYTIFVSAHNGDEPPKGVILCSLSCEI